MSQMLAERDLRRSALPGAVLLRRVRRLIILALVASLVYSTLVTASRGGCPGGYDSDGGFIDANGDPTAVAPSCFYLALGPSPLMFVLFALIGIGALSSALKKSRTEADALRYLDSAAAVIAGITVLSIVVSHIWFWNLPVMDWDGINDLNLIGPFPFAVMTTEVTPMAG